jgi:quinol monooxygenase YgiN
MNITYGFQATMTAKPGKADELVELLLRGPTSGPAAHDSCTVFLISRSSANPDVVHLVEGWASEAAHAAVFASPEAQAYIARFDELVTETQYTDFVPLGGKATVTTMGSARDTHYAT